MLAVLPWRAGAPRSPEVGDRPEPVAGPGEVVLAVRAAGLNRADLLQVRGDYPPPEGESGIPGLEAAGDVVAVGEGVDGWRIGDRVTALLAGGGQAERVAAPAGQLLRFPPDWSWEEAAALPEAALTAWTNLVAEGGLRAGETVLVAGATGGVGTFAVQLARELGARVLAAARDRGRLDRLRPLGAEPFELGPGLAEDVRRETAGRGVELVVDLLGGDWFPGLLAALAPAGRLVLVGLTAGRRADIDLGLVLRRRLRLIGSLLRPRSRAEKAVLVAAFRAFAGERLADGRLRPLVDRTFAFADVAAAYRHLESGRPFGKVILRVGA